MLACLLLDVDQRGAYSHYLLDFLEGKLLRNPSVSTVLMTVFAHLQRSAPDAAHSVLRDALESRLWVPFPPLSFFFLFPCSYSIFTFFFFFWLISCRTSPLLWSLYLQLEISNKRPQAAKGVFYRGLASCPWAKVFLLDSFRYLKDVLTEDETKMIHGLLEEKGLRSRTLVEEIELLREDPGGEDLEPMDLDTTKEED